MKRFVLFCVLTVFTAGVTGCAYDDDHDHHHRDEWRDRDHHDSDHHDFEREREHDRGDRNY